MSIWKNRNDYCHDLKKYLQQYREKLVKDAEYSAEIQLDIEYEKCVIYPIVAIVIGGLIGGFSWILTKLPIISILIVAFDLHIFAYTIAILCCLMKNWRILK